MNKFGAKETEQIFAEHDQRMAKRKLEDKKETRKLLLAYIGVSIAALFVIWISTLLIANSLTTISEVGLKSVVEQVWCGKDTTCRLSETK